MKKLFYNAISDIISTKKVNNITLKNIEIIKYVLNNKEITKKIYKKFKENYNLKFDSDKDYILMKVEDMVYRFHLLISIIINDYSITNKNKIRNTINIFLDNSTSIFEPVNYNSNDIEIIIEYKKEIVNYLVQNDK